MENGASPGVGPGVSRRRRPYACAWCGRAMVDSELGRRRKYCKRSCRQRAYEQRTLLEGTSIPDDAVILSAAEAADFGDRMFALRCAAEDLGTAVAERADHHVLAGLTDTLLDLAREAEKLR
ncbi:hypothetical protein [Gordonia sp. HS-NH1]|uniref:hypothetical protein n=1 Tax=Gordonia sp. HS-NH1 TaxID=1435068 RepID=UPI0018D184F4|nr:hypothetical protein [Gordonia sp. HS-NH1]